MQTADGFQVYKFLICICIFDVDRVFLKSRIFDDAGTPCSPNIEPFKPALAAVLAAQKLTKRAASSLGFEDVPSAIKDLQEALELLTKFSDRA
jgi:hypothetical protein